MGKSDNVLSQVKYYDNLWAQRLKLNYLQFRRAIKIFQYFSDIMHSNKQLKVLDLGCGDGRFTSFLGEFADTDAIELSEKAVETAKKNHPHVNFFQGSALDFEFEVEKYHVVISQEVIEHIEDQEGYMEVCSRVLKKGGYLIMTTPNKKVFDHMKGGNWSDQPIEKIMGPRVFKNLVSNKFKIVSYDSIIMNFGTLGYFKILNHRLVIGGCNTLGLKRFRRYLYSKLGFGLHQCVLAVKR